MSVRSVLMTRFHENARVLDLYIVHAIFESDPHIHTFGHAVLGKRERFMEICFFERRPQTFYFKKLFNKKLIF